MKLLIKNCEFLYKCPVAYSDLEQVSHYVRFCNICKRNVYQALSADQFHNYAKQGKCVSITINSNNGDEHTLLGHPCFDQDELENIIHYWKFNDLKHAPDFKVFNAILDSLINKYGDGDGRFVDKIFEIKEACNIYMSTINFLTNINDLDDATLLLESLKTLKPIFDHCDVQEVISFQIKDLESNSTLSHSK